MLAKTVATVFEKENERSFFVGIEPLKKKLPSHTHTHIHTHIITTTKPPRLCLQCHKEIHWAKKCQSKYDVERNPISKKSKMGTPWVLINKNQGQTPSFPSNLQHPGSAAIDNPALNDVLFLQTVPCKIPTSLWNGRK